MLQIGLRMALRFGLGAAFGIYLLVQIATSVHLCQGELVYSLDDAYIHMGLAKHLVEQGVWGVGDGFASASSSVLWPLALAAVYAVKGPDIYTPLVFEFLGLFGLMYFLHRLVRREFGSLDRRGWPVGVAFLAIVLVAPATTLALLGLEHIWHLVAVLVVVDQAAAVLSRDAAASPITVDPRTVRPLLWLAPLLTLIRFETLALVPVVAGLLFWRGYRRAAFLFFAGALLPVFLMGLGSMALGGFFWPNSLILKTGRLAPGEGLTAKLLAILQQLLVVAVKQPHFFLLTLFSLATLAVTLYFTRRFFTAPAMVLVLSLSQSLAHAIFGNFDWFYRYDAYLLSLAVFANLYAFAWLLRPLAATQPDSLPGQRSGWKVATAALILIVLAIPTGMLLARRSLEANRKTPLAARNIFEQQIQIARFLRQEYSGAQVAVNDIGAVSYFADFRPLDLFGIGSNEVVAARMDHNFGRQWLEKTAASRNLDIAVLYEPWFRDELPPSWIRVGEWEIQENVVCAQPVVTFFAATPEKAARLARSLARFDAQLPDRVRRYSNHSF